ncbi:hypothetical protein F5B22DRAFT_455723 [Xylaria bambusicola]|uniref:uncharacterized protein n=1 Tax=Xylaria bambusicola TaxID=326684 RepID=UPI002008D9C0|nr:uncharacterized protein F5B22DRAFT_455723 [Xylaria bambusicola]KAI0506315.1 hypothetical protein F5B22DRAFT_455723 [Xylaria bambusicola]
MEKTRCTDIGASHTMSSEGIHAARGDPTDCLPCEFGGYYNYCDMVFAVDDVESWVEHIVNVHLQGKLPQKAVCWFCDDIVFDSERTKDRRVNFDQRMRHIHAHILEGKGVNDMRPDHCLNVHLREHQLIEEDAFNITRRYSEVPIFIQALHEIGPQTRRKIHSPIHQLGRLDELDDESPRAYTSSKAGRSRKSRKSNIASKAGPTPALAQDALKSQSSPVPSTSAEQPIPASSKHLEGHNRDTSMSDHVLIWKLSEYSIIRFKKATEGLEEDDQRIWPNWEKCIITQDDSLSKEDAREHIQQLNKILKLTDKQVNIPTALKRHVDLVLERLQTHDPDKVNFHWTLEQLEHGLKTVNKAVLDHIGHASSTGKRFLRNINRKKAYERVSLTAYFKRSPRPGVDLWKVWETTKYNSNNPAKAILYFPKPHEGEQHNVIANTEFDKDDLLYPYDSDESSGLGPEENVDNHRESQQIDDEREERKKAHEHASKTNTITVEQSFMSNSEFDSGYRSLSNAKQTLESVNEIEPPTYQNFLYSEAGSLDGRTDNYAQYLADELIAKLNNELKDVDWAKFRISLSRLLQEFAIRVGNEGETQSHRDLMYWTHKWHEDIVKHIEKQQVLCDKDYEDELQKKEGDPDWRDRIGLLFDRDDQDCTLDPISSTEGKALASIEIEPYQQIVSRSRAFEWLVFSIRNSIILDTVNDSAMDAVKQRILQKLELHDQKRGYGAARISRHRNPASYRASFTLDWPSTRNYQEGNSFKSLSDIFERVLTFTGESKRAQALLCEDYICQTWPSTGPFLIQSVLKALNRDTKRNGASGSLQERDSLIKIQISEGVMRVHRQGNAFELAETGMQLAWLASALLPQPKFNQGIICKPRVCFSRLDSENDTKYQGEADDFCCHFEVTTTTFDLGKVSSENGNCWQTVMNNFVIVDGFPIRSRPGGKPGLDIPLNIAADFIGTRKVIHFKGRPLIKGFSTMLCPISSEDGVVYWHVLKSGQERISFADGRIDRMSTIKPGSLKVRDLENSRHVIGWCTEVKQIAGTIDANLDIRRTNLKQPPNEWALKEIQVGGGQYINVLATFAVRKEQKSLHIERDRSDYSGNMEWIAKRHIILHDTEASERRAWLIDGASALLYLVFTSLWKNQHGVMRDSYTFDFQQLKGFFGSRPSGMVTSLSVLMNPKFLGTRLRARDPMNPSDWYLLRNRVDEIFDLLAQMIDHQEDVNPDSGLGHFVSFSPWKHHVGWAFSDIASPGEPCNLKTTYLKQHGEGWAYFARELHAVTLFGHGFGDLLRPAIVTPDPCNRCLWGSLAPKGGDILAVSLEDLKLHSESSDQRRLETRYILGQRLSEASRDSCFRACSSGSCTSQRIQTFHRVPGKGYDPIWEDASLPELDERCSSNSINGAALLGVRPTTSTKWRASRRKRDQKQPDGLHQSHIDSDELCVADGGSNSTNESSSITLSHESMQMTSLQTPSTPGSSVSRQLDSSFTIDEGITSIPAQVSKGKTPIRRIHAEAHDWVHKLKLPRKTSKGNSTESS